VTPDEQKGIDDARKTVDAIAKLTADDRNRPAASPTRRVMLVRSATTTRGGRRELPQRLLILQGARDYQVTTVDYEKWHSALAAKPNAEFHLYPALNHLFLPGTGRACPPASVGQRAGRSDTT
jgi:fermentation-respiration switch protein FrsA (DUF1100 family)